MTEKRYYAHKHLLKENEVHDKRCHNFMSFDETIEHMNDEYWKYKQLKNENEQLNLHHDELRLNYNELRHANDIYCKKIDSLKKENKQLKSELEEVIEVCRKYGIYKEELQSVLADFDKILGENGERAIRYKYCVNSG